MQTGIIDAQDVLRFAGMESRVIAGLDGAAPYTIMDMCIAPGGGAPAHRSIGEDKTFVILEGALEFRFGACVRTVVAGDALAVARGDLHGFVNRLATPARMLLVASPARHDGFFRAMAALPVPHDIDAVRRISSEFAQQIEGL
ncbi:cupin domain-containing protein [Burkholderia sp. Ax-1719]|uniref:cupin domain-containing protein n=1 Tax=Burkholderia sp. Ax-1719 TaxID=2608334 RepID=UPI001422EE6A|nr:cupin domain-containing protein [Burkholderia sp. Ax-1719]NIE65347.1 cupin domain-containing protein [Burkholderia sp. Ax-1719]